MATASARDCLSVQGLVKHFGPVVAVRGVSFEVAPGEILGLLGPNGAGKTTTLECILGLLRPDGGSVSFGGVDSAAFPAKARQRVGAQLQSTFLQDKIRPREALDLFGAFYPRGPGTDELIARFGLVEKADASFDSLSGGQRQRLGLALAFVNDPQFIVLDEPTAGLDPQARRDLRQMISACRASGKTIVLSTHSTEEAHQLCDRVAIIDHGVIIASAAPEELMARAKALPRIIVRAARPISASRMESLDGVAETRAVENGWDLGTADINRTIAGLMGALESEGNPLMDLQIRRPSLEDVFIELTGRDLASDPAMAT